MGAVKIKHSEQEEYFGDVIYEKDRKESNTATIQAKS